MKTRWVEIVVLGVTIVLAVIGSYVATVRAVTITDERSKNNERRIEAMELSLNQKIDKLIDKQELLHDLVIEMRTELRLSRK